MAQVTQNTSDTEEWSRGQGEFYIASRSTVTNRRTDVTSKTYQTGSNAGSDSEGKIGNRQGYTVYRSEDEVPFSESKNSSAIHVDVRPSYPPVDVPIQRISTTGRTWSASGEQRNYVYPSETLIVSPPAARNSSRRSRRTLRQGSETRVVTKMTIPPLESPSLGRPRNQRSYSSDILQESERRKQYEQSTLNSNFRQMNVRDAPTRSHSTSKRKKDHHSHCCCHHHSKIRPSSRSRARDIYGTVRGVPMTIGYTTPTFAVYHDYAPMSPAGYYYHPDEYATPVPGVPYLASPAIPIHYSLPRRYPTSATFGRAGIPPSAIPTMTPGTASRYPQVFPRSARTPGQYHCVCCPNGAHQSSAERNSHVFNFESDQCESDGLPPLNPNQYGGRSTLTKRGRSRQQYMETQRIQQQSATSGTMESGRKSSRQTPNEFEIPIQKETPSAVPYGFVSPGGTLNETTFTSQRYQNTWNATLSPKVAPGMPLLHGEVIRDDGFPSDYVDLTDVGIEYTNGMEEGDDGDSLPPPDKRVVLSLAESALKTATGPTQVAATLKKSMDEHFGPVWHVIAGTGAYGSNIASLGGQLLHFKAFGWAFLIWKTSDQQPE